MKNLLLGTAMALALTTAATAQEMFRTEMDPVKITASDFIGKRVYAAANAVDAEDYAGVQEGWEDIGEINDVILNRDGTVDSVLLDIGGFLGMGERQVAVGMESIHFVADSATADAPNDYFIVVNADRTVLEGAPEYNRSGGMMADPAADAATTEGVAAAPMTNDAAAAEGQAVPADGAMAVEGTAGNAMATTDGYAAIDAAGITADQLTGVRVYGPNDEDLGEISEVVLSDTGAPGQVIVDVGGFLGMGEKPVALDFSSVQLFQSASDGALRAHVQMTKDQLETLPAVEK